MASSLEHLLDQTLYPEGFSRSGQTVRLAVKAKKQLIQLRPETYGAWLIGPRAKFDKRATIWLCVDVEF